MASFFTLNEKSYFFDLSLEATQLIHTGFVKLNNVQLSYIQD